MSLALLLSQLVVVLEPSLGLEAQVVVNVNNPDSRHHETTLNVVADLVVLILLKRLPFSQIFPEASGDRLNLGKF